MVKKTCQAFESLNSDVRDRSYVRDEHETYTKNRISTNSASELTNPLELVKKQIQAFESLNSKVRARNYAQITVLGIDQ